MSSTAKSISDKEYCPRTKNALSFCIICLIFNKASGDSNNILDIEMVLENFKWFYGQIILILFAQSDML